MAKLAELGFLSIEIHKALPAPAHSVSQRPTMVLIRSLILLTVVSSSLMNIDTSITDSIIRKAINETLRSTRISKASFRRFTIYS